MQGFLPIVSRTRECSNVALVCRIPSGTGTTVSLPAQQPYSGQVVWRVGAWSFGLLCGQTGGDIFEDFKRVFEILKRPEFFGQSGPFLFRGNFVKFFWRSERNPTACPC